MFPQIGKDARIAKAIARAYGCFVSFKAKFPRILIPVLPFKMPVLDDL
jgi:hypothetical protein